jgi:hypothetical protein
MKSYINDDNWPPGSYCIALTCGSLGLNQHQICVLHGPKEHWSQMIPVQTGDEKCLVSVGWMQSNLPHQENVQ